MASSIFANAIFPLPFQTKLKRASFSRVKPVFYLLLSVILSTYLPLTTSAFPRLSSSPTRFSPKISPIGCGESKRLQIYLPPELDGEGSSVHCNGAVEEDVFDSSSSREADPEHHSIAFCEAAQDPPLPHLLDWTISSAGVSESSTRGPLQVYPLPACSWLKFMWRKVWGYDSELEKSSPAFASTVEAGAVDFATLSPNSSWGGKVLDLQRDCFNALTDPRYPISSTMPVKHPLTSG